MASTTLLFPDSFQPAPTRWLVLWHAWLPAVLFAAIFAIESTAAFGSDHTSVPLHSFFKHIFGSVVDRNWSLLHHLIRKTGHFTGYSLFSLVCFRGFGLTRQYWLKSLGGHWTCHILSIAAVFFVASADEIHQAFLPNRTGCFSDVLLDTAGALAAQLMLTLSMRVIAARRGSA